jgi:hypothetical protein
VLLILVGSDLSVMQALQPYGRPFFGRAAKMTVNPLHLADVHAMTGLDAAEAVDALLITGGFPEVVQAWQPGLRRSDYLRQELANPLSPIMGTLLDRKVLAADNPLSTRADTKNKRHRIADPYLRFWLSFSQHRHRGLWLLDRVRRVVRAARSSGLERSLVAPLQC